MVVVGVGVVTVVAVGWWDAERVSQEVLRSGAPDERARYMVCLAI